MLSNKKHAVESKKGLFSFQQEEYQGLIEVQQDNTKNDEKQAATTKATPNQTYYPFGITSLMEKKEALQAGDKVSVISGGIEVNSLQPSFAFLYPLKTSENL